MVSVSGSRVLRLRSSATMSCNMCECPRFCSRWHLRKHVGIVYETTVIPKPSYNSRLHMLVKCKRILCTETSHEEDHHDDPADQQAKSSEHSRHTWSMALRTSLYISSIGIVAILFPQVVLRCMVLLSSDPQQGVLPTMYIQLGGTLASLFGFYYAGAAMDDIQGRYPENFYKSTIAARYFLAIIFAVLFYANQKQHLWLVLLGTMNALSAFMLQRAMSKRMAEQTRAM